MIPTSKAVGFPGRFKWTEEEISLYFLNKFAFYISHKNSYTLLSTYLRQQWSTWEIEIWWKSVETLNAHQPQEAAV